MIGRVAMVIGICGALGACSSRSRGGPAPPDAAVAGRAAVPEDAGAAPPKLDAGAAPHEDDKDAGQQPDAMPPTAAGDDDAGAAPRELTWRRGSDCPVARFEASSLLFKGELWVLGGFVTESLEVTRRVDIYDPAHDSWRRGPNLPGAETHFGILADGEDVLVFGGLDKSMAGNVTDAVWRLPASASDWTKEPALPAPRAAFAWAILGNKLHIAGGLAADNNTDSPSHIVRELGVPPSWQNAADLPDPRNHGGGVVSGGKFYAVAGRHNWDETAGHTTSLHAFDPGSGAWQPLAAMPIARSEISSATFTTSDGRIITVGGSTAGVKPSRDVFEYAQGRGGGARGQRSGRHHRLTHGHRSSRDHVHRLLRGVS
jgi:hypothetical protein